MSHELRIPKWVNKENFHKMLSQAIADLEDITFFRASRAMVSGENYSTLILRVQIEMKLKDGTVKKSSFMLKLPHETKEMKEILASLNFFHVENVTYIDIINEMEKMYKDVGIEVKFGAQCYRLPTDSQELYVLLEDLCSSGFRNVNRLNGLDVEHTEFVLRKLALFHAASACRVAKLGPYPEALFVRNLDFEHTRERIQGIYGLLIEAFMNNLQKYKNGEKYREPLLKFYNNVTEWFVNASAMHKKYFNVLNHGDIWTNNILFKYKADGHVEETYFIDYQNCNYGSPVQDLYVLIISSVHIDVKLKKFDHFIDYYYKHLVENLELLKYPLVIMSRNQLQEQLKVFGGWSLLTSLFITGIALLEPTDKAKIENVIRDTPEGIEFRNLIYSNSRYIQHIEEILPWIYERGFMNPENLLEDLGPSISSKIKKTS
uniref:CHK domain-containing protein n=1 Tax=Glossina austeni TaxID=7395 RepID=A0A1A9VBF6_GLOAU